MADASTLMATGMPSAQANLLGATTGSALTANNTTKATGTAIINSSNFFTTVASTGAAVLPPAGTSPPIAIYNGGANPLLVFANGTDTINALSAAQSFSVTNAKAAIFTPSGTRWVANLSA